MSDDMLTAITKAVIAALNDAGVGEETDQPTGDVPLLTAKAQPPRPDRIISVTAYDRDAQPDPHLQNETVRVQLWIRGIPDDPLDPDGIAGRAFDALHGRHHVTWNGISIDRCVHNYGGPMGPDDQRRWERTENYLITTQRSA